MTESLGGRIVEYLETLKISEGRHRGKTMQVLAWQRRICHGIEDAMVVALSMSRGNGKTLYAAGLACAALDPDGPLFQPRGEIDLIASSLSQARIPFKHIYYFMADRIEREKRDWRVVNNSHHLEIEHRPSGTTLKALGSDPRRAHGLAPSLVISDEPAKWVGGGREMFVALSTSLGKQMDSKLIAIGTRPDVADHWFSKLLDTKSPSVLSVLYAAEKEDDDFAMETILKANPSFDHMIDLQRSIMAEREEAMTGGPALSAFRALRLNKGTPEVAEKEAIVSLQDWKAAERQIPPPREGKVFIDIDLGDGNSMSALVSYWPMTGRLEAYGAFPAEPHLAERGKIDYVGDRYLTMQERGELFVYPGVATNNVAFLTDCFEMLTGEDIGGIFADRYKQNDVKQALNTIGRNADNEVTWRGVGHGPHGAEDIRAFRREVLERKMAPADHLGLQSAIMESVLRRDPNGNPSLDKKRQRGRIDMLQAGVLAVGAGRKWREPTDGPGLAGLHRQMAEAGMIVGGV